MMIDWVLLGLRVASLFLLYGFLSLVLYKYRQLQKHLPPFDLYLNRLDEPNLAIPLLVETSIGRAENNVVVLEDDFISTHHALLTYRHKSWYVMDLDSTNGTLVNNKTINTLTKLTPGDTLKLGQIQFKLERRQ